jgi:hypothetical protein
MKTWVAFGGLGEGEGDKTVRSSTSTSSGMGIGFVRDISGGGMIDRDKK